MAIKTRRGSAGEDVTATEQFVEDVVATDEDQSYEVEGTDSPEETVQEATVITDDHEVVNPIEDGEIAEEEIEESREGRRGSRKGESDEETVEEVIMNEDGDTQEVELPEPDEEELEEREGRRGRRTRRGSRKGETMNWDGIDFEAIAGELEKLGEDPWDLDFDEIYDLAEAKGLKPDQFDREGSRKGSRKGIAYGGKSEVHQESIKAAVAVAMRDRRL